MSGKTRNIIYRKSIDSAAQTLPDIITLSCICSIRIASVGWRNAGLGGCRR